MIGCRSCGAKLAEVVQGKALIACPKCHTLNFVVSQGSVRVDIAGVANVASTRN